MITVAIAEDHQSLSDGIHLLLEYEEDITLIGHATDGEVLLDLIRKKTPDVILMDIKMPKIDGIVATRLIKKEWPHIHIIAFSMFDQTSAVTQMLDAGVSGYLLKNSPLEEVLNAIRAVVDGKEYFDASINIASLRQDAEQSQKKPLLSKSEREILKLIGQGKTTSEIADIRFTAVSTVEKHRKNMIRKLGLSGKGELLRYALERKYNFE